MIFFQFKNFEYIVYKRKKIIKNLFLSLKQKSGRSNIGHLIHFRIGGGFKRYYRLIDFKRLFKFIPFCIIKFEYDPNRNLYIMLLLYLNGVLAYALAPLLVKILKFYNNFDLLSIKNGVSFKLIYCLIGSFIHCVKINNLICKYGRAAGVYIQLVRKFGSYVLLRLPSKEELFLNNKNICILGRLSNVNFKLIKFLSAGYYRRLGYKSIVRGVAKNPIDHPHGGGEGRTTAGQPSVSPWSIYTKGIRTTTRFNRLSFLKWGFFKRRNAKVW